MPFQNEPEIRAFYLDGLTGLPFLRGIPSDVILRKSISQVFVLHGSADPTLALVDGDPTKGYVHLLSPPDAVLRNATSGSVGGRVSELSQVTLLEGVGSQGVKGLHALLETGSDVSI